MNIKIMKVGDRVITPHGPGFITNITARYKRSITVKLDNMWAEHHNWRYSENELKKIKI